MSRLMTIQVTGAIRSRIDVAAGAGPAHMLSGLQFEAKWSLRRMQPEQAIFMR
jgi:hypothetical protein